MPYNNRHTTLQKELFMTPVFMHIRPLIDGKQSQQGMTAAMKFLDDNNVVTDYNNATTLIVGLSATSKCDTFNKQTGREVAIQNLESKPLRFTLEQWKTKAVEIYNGDIVDFLDIEFKSMTINDLCDMIIAAKTFGDLPSKAFRALVYTEIAEYAYKHLSMFKPKQHKPYCVIPDFVL